MKKEIFFNKNFDLKKILRKVFCFFFFGAFVQNSFAGVFIEPNGAYAIDLPEGFAIANQDEESLLLVNKVVPLDCLIATTKQLHNNIKMDAQKAFARVCDEIDSEYSFKKFSWNEKDCVISELKFPVPKSGRTSYYAGWGITVPMENEQGFLTVLAYTESYWTKVYEPFIFSILDAISINDGDLVKEGAVTAKNFPKTTKEEYTIRIDNEDVSFSLFSVDKVANDSVIKREFAVLKEYDKALPTVKTEAFKRYYRMIFKDAFMRLQDAGFKLGNHFRFKDGKLQDDNFVAKGFLSLVQDFKYKRDLKNTDFINLPEALATKTGDCDPRSMLLVILLKHNQIGSIMMLSQKLKHAIAAVDVEGVGARFTHNKKKYLVAETTAKVNLGLIAQDFSEITAWEGVEFF